MLTAIKNNKSLSFYQNIAEPRQRKADSLPIAGMISPAIGSMTYSTVTYTNDVNQAFSDLVANVSRRGMQYANNTVASRGGYMAENFVADSYNLDATIKRSDAPRATVPEENGLSSPDIQYGDEQASLKFYKDAKSSAMRQSDPGYGDQHRIVPSDQVDDAKAELAKKAQENRAKGRENAATQQEKTRDLIDDRIHGKDGTESTPMTKKQNDDLSKTIKKDENGNVIVIHCTYDPETKSGSGFTGRKVKGTIHWVAAKTAVKAECRLYENLIDEEKGVYNEDGSMNLNPNSLTVLKECYLEPSLKDAKAYDSFQFVRNGFFCVDAKDSKEDALVFNRIVSLKSSFKLPAAK